jgi:uncharacterized membrane protein
MLDGFLAALENSALAAFVGETAGAYPFVSALHILGIALLIGPIVLVDLRLMGLLRASLSPMATTLLVRTAMIGFAIAIVTGVALFSVQALKYAHNPIFQMKLALIVLAGANALALRLSGRGIASELETPRRRIFGAASLLLWLGVLFAGRWIAFA